MALADYRTCDVCGAKAFYDASLNYDLPDAAYEVPLEEQVKGFGYRLDHLGDWAVICLECAKTHKCIIQKLPQPEQP
jgi:hypothetical protein